MYGSQDMHHSWNHNPQDRRRVSLAHTRTPYSNASRNDVSASRAQANEGRAYSGQKRTFPRQVEHSDLQSPFFSSQSQNYQPFLRWSSSIESSFPSTKSTNLVKNYADFTVPHYEADVRGHNPYRHSDTQSILASPALMGAHSPIIEPPCASSSRSAPRKYDSGRPSSSWDHFEAIEVPRQVQPTVRDIDLVSPTTMPDAIRSIFPYTLFNAIQSKCFHTAFQTDDNLVVSAPTGSGKTVVLEMAVCRAAMSLSKQDFKAVYMAPTKSLCNERQRDWSTKFSSMGLECAELTGDTDSSRLRSVQRSHIIITTPEKWDSMTRKWNDHARLMQLVKLLMIDEVHMLKDSRGATLEAVVSRMKAMSTSLRFVALSATVPNSEDIAVWLGRSQSMLQRPAVCEKFGEDFRPVKLQKHVVGLSYKGNDFGFEGVCDPQLPSIIAKYSQRKAMMIFCMTRKSTVNTARLLANHVKTGSVPQCHWPISSSVLNVLDAELRNTISQGVAFHHAGLDATDRLTIERGFLDGSIGVICCTSTLAVGVNLPCHIVIIKNTVSYQQDGIKEYSDLEIMQMLGRAGRPQFDDNAVAVILTKNTKVSKYEQLVSGTQIVESCLHSCLTEYINAEIGLGTISDLASARKWLASTFLYVRLGQNPDHYRIDELPLEGTLEEKLDRLCERELELLQINGLCVNETSLRSTKLGEAMSRYYIDFGTMKNLLRLKTRATTSEIVSNVVQANEFRDIRFRLYEKKWLKEINSSAGIRFPIKVDIATSFHKRSLIIQAELGGVDFPSGEQFLRHRRQYTLDKNILLAHMPRILCCIIDSQVFFKDAVTLRNTLELARSCCAAVWDTSPFQLKQLPQIGAATVRRLVKSGIKSIEDLEAAESHQVESILSKNPPFGTTMLTNVQRFPRLRISIAKDNKIVRSDSGSVLRLRLNCGFMNEEVPLMFSRTPIHVCLLTERSDGYLVDFRRMSAKQVGHDLTTIIEAEITDAEQFVIGTVVCDRIAGTLRSAELRLDRPFMEMLAKRNRSKECAISQPNPYIPERSTQILKKMRSGDIRAEFDDIDVQDQDMIAALEAAEYKDVDAFIGIDSHHAENEDAQDWTPEKLANGKFGCNHRCKNKLKCRHLCCNEGLDTRPKPPKRIDRNSTKPSSVLNSGSLPAHSDKLERVNLEKVNLASTDHGKQSKERCGFAVADGDTCDVTRWSALDHNLRDNSQCTESSAINLGINGSVPAEEILAKHAERRDVDNFSHLFESRFTPINAPTQLNTPDKSFDTQDITRWHDCHGAIDFEGHTDNDTERIILPGVCNAVAKTVPETEEQVATNEEVLANLESTYTQASVQVARTSSKQNERIDSHDRQRPTLNEQDEAPRLSHDSQAVNLVNGHHCHNPAWVRGLDPTFVAEYQDFVVFV